MNSSAVNARISATAEAMRRPVAMYGTALGSVIRQRRPERPTPERAGGVIATGSTSRTPYIVCTRIGQKAPNAARKTSLLMFVPSVRKSSGISAAEGIGRRNSTGHPERARGEVAEPEEDPERNREDCGDAQPERPALHGVRECAPERRRPHHGSELGDGAVIEGRSRSSTSPVCETNCQRSSAEAIETTKIAASVRRLEPTRRRPRAGRLRRLPKPRALAGVSSRVCSATGDGPYADQSRVVKTPFHLFEHEPSNARAA